MIKVMFEYVNDNGEWIKGENRCSSLIEANLKVNTINNNDRFRNPIIINK